MTIHAKLSVIITFLLISFSWKVQSQDFSKSTLKLGFGAGVSMGRNTDGLGINYSIGYQREIWNDRWRFNPNLSIGNYSSKHVMDARDQYFSSYNLNAILFYDLLRGNTSSVVIGAGLLLNNSRGLIGTGGKDNYTDPNPVSSEYFSYYSVGGYLGAGIRLNSPNKCTAICIMPLNLHFGKDFTEFYMKVEVDLKFKN